MAEQTPLRQTYPRSAFHRFWETITLIISGPSGVGKSTILRRLLGEYPWMEFSISHTTRPPRPGEENARDYYFVDEAKFGRLAAADAFIEHATVHGFRYGTSREELERIRGEHKTPLIEVDVQGALSIKEHVEGTILVMLLPPSFEELEARLRGRRSEDEASVKRRLDRAVEEMKLYAKYHYYVVNADREETVENLKTMIAALQHHIEFVRPEFIQDVLRTRDRTAAGSAD
jgi:guanylate kinase